MGPLQRLLGPFQLRFIPGLNPLLHHCFLPQRGCRSKSQIQPELKAWTKDLLREGYSFPRSSKRWREHCSRLFYISNSEQWKPLPATHTTKLLHLSTWVKRHKYKNMSSSKFVMLRADKILKLLTKINQHFSVCLLYWKPDFHQFCLNHVCQLVLYEHVKSSNRSIILKLWLYAGPLKETLPGGTNIGVAIGGAKGPCPPPNFWKT